MQHVQDQYCVNLVQKFTTAHWMKSAVNSEVQLIPPLADYVSGCDTAAEVGRQAEAT